MKARFGIIVGHASDAQGAVEINGPVHETEFQWNSDAAERIKKHLVSLGYDAVIATLVPGNGVGSAWNKFKMYPDIKAVIELHFNATPKARGSEVMYSDKLPASKKLAEIMDAEMDRVFERTGKTNRPMILRSYNGGKPEGRAWWNCNHGWHPYCLVEPFFGDNPEDAKLGDERKQPYCEALAEGFIKFIGDEIPVLKFEYKIFESIEALKTNINKADNNSYLRIKNYGKCIVCKVVVPPENDMICFECHNKYNSKINIIR